jgi:hypothetical protein
MKFENCPVVPAAAEPSRAASCTAPAAPAQMPLPPSESVARNATSPPELSSVPSKSVKVAPPASGAA